MSNFCNIVWNSGESIDWNSGEAIVWADCVDAGAGKNSRKRSKVIRLNELANREETADFIKSFLKTTEVEIDGPVVYMANKQNLVAELAELVTKNMNIESEKEMRNQYNNQVILFMLMAA